MLRSYGLAILLVMLATPSRAQVTAVAPPQVVVAPSQKVSALERLARKIEPGLEGRADRLAQYVDFFRLKLANDTRLFAFDVATEADASGEVVLRGYVEFPETRAALERYLGFLGFDEVENRLETLPAADLGEQRFGFVKTTHSLIYDAPNGKRSVVTDCLLGEPLFILRRQQDHLLVHCGDGYLGFVAEAEVHRVDAAAFARYPSEPSVRMIANFRLDSGLIVPTGARLKRLPGDGNVLCALPTGEPVSVMPTSCEEIQSPKAKIERAIASGRQLLGTPYLWGGKTSDGIDCSGLVQVAFATTGVHFPRDSNQQLLLGRLVATRWYQAGLQRGDTLYFLGENGRIRHTALYLGNDRYMQAEEPFVEISSLNPQHEDYDPKRAATFAFAKRFLQ